MKNLIIAICLTTTIGMANPKSQETSSCKVVYESINTMLKQDLITLKEAQTLWVKHKNNEWQKEV